MTKDIDPSAVRVLFSYQRPYVVLGPLGCYHVGQRVTLPEGSAEGHPREVTISRIDPDGAGVAWTAEREMPAMFLRSAPCKGINEVAVEGSSTFTRIGEGMLAQQERNRREHDVVLPDEMAQAA